MTIPRLLIFASTGFAATSAMGIFVGPEKTQKGSRHLYIVGYWGYVVLYGYL